MNIDLNTPEILLLLQEVERCASISPRLVSDFTLLASIISEKTRERLSQSTLERIWKYSTRRSDFVSLHSLDVLSRYANYSNWESFQKHVNDSKHPESFYFEEGIIDVDLLQIGSCLKIAWLPNRMVIVKYQGNSIFKVCESLNSSINPGDSFQCNQIQVGQPLYMDSFIRNSETRQNKRARYVVGKDHGITLAQILNNEKT